MQKNNRLCKYILAYIGLVDKKNITAMMMANKMKRRQKMEGLLLTKLTMMRIAMRDYVCEMYHYNPLIASFNLISRKKNFSVPNDESTAELCNVLYLLSFFLEEATKKDREIVVMDKFIDVAIPISYLAQRAVTLREDLDGFMNLEDLEIEPIF
jgi:hypothetical protein